jgi:hypothetical protein
MSALPTPAQWPRHIRVAVLAGITCVVATFGAICLAAYKAFKDAQHREGTARLKAALEREEYQASKVREAWAARRALEAEARATGAAPAGPISAGGPRTEREWNGLLLGKPAAEVKELMDAPLGTFPLDGHTTPHWHYFVEVKAASGEVERKVISVVFQSGNAMHIEF